MQHGWPVTAAAEAQQVSRQTAYRWLRRYRQNGIAGLADRPPIAHRRPHALSPQAEQRILRARRARGWGPQRLACLLGLPRSTIYGLLRRHRVPRLADLDRPTQRPVRYQRAHPGELVHLDVKKLARIPQGGGHRLRDRATTPRGRRGGYDFLHVAVDDCSRLACVQTYPNERGPTTARFLTQAHAFFRQRGLTLQAVMTDRACIAPTPPASAPCPPGSPPTITTDPTPPSMASFPCRSLSTRLVGITSRPGVAPSLRTG